MTTKTIDTAKEKRITELKKNWDATTEKVRLEEERRKHLNNRLAELKEVLPGFEKSVEECRRVVEAAEGQEVGRAKKALRLAELALSPSVSGINEINRIFARDSHLLQKYKNLEAEAKKKFLTAQG